MARNEKLAELGIKLKEYRIRAGYNSIYGVAKVTGISRASIMQYERGNALPTVLYLNELIYTYNLTDNEIKEIQTLVKELRKRKKE
jgi:DNA-binding XRE family transcriptional regulator